MPTPRKIVITRESDGYHVAAYFANSTIRHIRALPTWIGYLRAVGWTRVFRREPA